VDLTIDVGKKNFVVCGPNGTGKSGVVDAIGFALSGDISRLSGKGQGAVSVKKHAPHVDYRNSPDEAVVVLEGTIAKTGEEFSITRTVGDSKNPVITPNTNTVNDTLGELGRHKNSTLSRRELIQYVLSTPGDRAAEIQALLQLNFLSDTRKNLQKISNTCARKFNLLKEERDSAGKNLASAAGIPLLKIQALLEEVNKRRSILELPKIVKLEANTSVKDGLTVVTEKTTKGVSKSIAQTDLETLDSDLSEFTSQATKDHTLTISDRLEALRKGGEFEEGVNKQSLLTLALDIFDEELCPVCETIWKPEEFTGLVQTKLNSLKDVLKEKGDIEKALEKVISPLPSLQVSVANIVKLGANLTPKCDTKELRKLAEQYSAAKKQINQFTSIDVLLSNLKSLHSTEKALDDELLLIRGAVTSLLDTSERDAARDYLVEVDVRLDAFREAMRNVKASELKAKTATTVFENFDKTYSHGLTKIYKDIQKVFAELYREINKEDEAGFEAELAIERSGVGLDVDFFGRGKFPPGAYHSEGHQDGMGLCLYLALMDHLYGDGFKFCVLDDVLMSVDSGHRRAVCAMLCKKFPNTQFLFTTHDEVWLKNMQSTGLVESGNQLHFRNWSVEGGPSEWIAEDIWVEIDELVVKNDIPGASAKLRHYFEYLSGELCHGLGAPVVFRGDSRYALGQLLPNATSQFAKLYRLGKVSAESWKDTELRDQLAATEQAFKELVNEQKLEEWGINATVHYNPWAALSKEDFNPIVKAFKNIDEAVRCEKCNGLLYLTPHFGPKEMLKCDCANVSVNLKKKP